MRKIKILSLVLLSTILLTSCQSQKDSQEAKLTSQTTGGVIETTLVEQQGYDLHDKIGDLDKRQLMKELYNTEVNPEDNKLIKGKANYDEQKKIWKVELMTEQYIYRFDVYSIDKQRVTGVSSISFLENISEDMLDEFNQGELISFTEE